MPIGGLTDTQLHKRLRALYGDVEVRAGELIPK
jgi:hypothetical protein